MAQNFSQKAPFNDWWYWSECLVKRLRTMCDLYRENGENEHADQANEWAKKIKDNCMTPVVAARKGLKTDEQKTEVKRLEEDAIFNAAILFREMLVNLPFMSSAIQDFLYVKWQECKWEDPADQKEEIDEDTGLPIRKKKKKSGGDSRIIELFWGPKARQDEGIRSGKVEDGGLPGILNNLLAAEKTTSSRSPTEYGQAMLASVTQQGVTMQQTGPKPGGFP